MKKIYLTVAGLLLLLLNSVVFADPADYTMTLTNNVDDNFNLQTQGQIIKHQQGDLSPNDSAVITYVPTPAVSFHITSTPSPTCDLTITVYSDRFEMNGPWPDSCPQLIINSIDLRNLKIALGGTFPPANKISKNTNN